MSSVATCLALWFVIQQRAYETRVHDIDELRQRLLHVWRGLEQSLIDDTVDHYKRACVLVFVPVMDIFTYFVTISLLSLYLMNFVSHHA